MNYMMFCSSMNCFSWSPWQIQAFELSTPRHKGAGIFGRAYAICQYATKIPEVRIRVELSWPWRLCVVCAGGTYIKPKAKAASIQHKTSSPQDRDSFDEGIATKTQHPRMRIARHCTQPFHAGRSRLCFWSFCRCFWFFKKRLQHLRAVDLRAFQTLNRKS